MPDSESPMKVTTVYFQVNVGDMERAKRFYSDVLGLEVVFAPPPEAGWCEMQLPGGAPRLGLNLPAEGSETSRSGRMMMEVEDIEGAKAYLEGRGVETSDYTDIPGMVTYFYIEDTEGNAIQIVSEPRVKG